MLQPPISRKPIIPDKPSPESPRRIGGPLVMRIVIAVIIGAALGSALGYFGQCSTGTCPLTSTWWRGAIYGGVLGLLFGLSAK